MIASVTISESCSKTSWPAKALSSMESIFPLKFQCVPTMQQVETLQAMQLKFLSAECKIWMSLAAHYHAHILLIQ